MTHALPTAVAALCLLAAEAGARGTQEPTARPQLAGVWRLNVELSGEAPSLPGEATTRARDAGVLPAASLRKKPRNGLDLHAVARVRTALREWLGAVARLTFSEEAPTVSLTDGSGRTLDLVPGGRPLRGQYGELSVEIAAAWGGASLVMERRYPDRTVVSESYVTFTHPRQLVVTSTIGNPLIAEPASMLTRVYDLVPSPPARRD